MRSSRVVWSLVAVSSLVVSACGDDTSTGEGGGGNGTTATTSSPSASSTSTATGPGAGGDGPGAGGDGPGAGGDGPGAGGDGPGAGGDGPGAGGDGPGAGGAAPECGDGVLNGDEACDEDDLGDATCESEGFWFGTLGCNDDCELVTLDCVGVEVCGDGRDNDLDGAPDCADLACLGEPACGDEGDEICGNLDDDDDDDLIDCADPDCADQPVCTPGDGPTGSACTVPSDCASAEGDDPLCLSTAFGSLHGYCSEFCDVVDQDCADGSVCLGTTLGLCFLSCENSGDCQPGYDCVPSNVEGMGSVCSFGPGNTEICDNDIDDDGDGDVDCLDLSCLDDAACSDSEVNCTDNADDDDDDLVDCADPTVCGSLFICEPGDRPAGSPCTLPSDCEAPGGIPACLTEAVAAGGYCSSQCEDSDDCSAGAECIGADDGPGLCLAGCDGLYDCRPGQLCLSFLAEVPICYPLEQELCGNGFDDNGNDLIDCDDPLCVDALGCTEPETNCTDGVDNDSDAFVDCADISECGGVSEDCEPGDGAAGEACEANTDCNANAGDPFCRTADSGFPDGYCAEWCDPAAQDCGAGATCVQLTELNGVCYATCDDESDCRDGYVCESEEDGGPTVCTPEVI